MFLKVFRRFREKSAIIFIIALLKGVIIEIIYPIVITWKLYNSNNIIIIMYNIIIICYNI